MHRSGTPRRRWHYAVAGALAIGLAAVGTVAYAATDDATSPTLREAAAARGLLIGAAVSGEALTATGVEQEYYDTLATQFSSVTAENSMKWESLQPEPGKFTFEQGDKLVAIAQANGQKVRGHTLVWYNQQPAWVNAITDKAEAERVLENHIKTVVGHYKGKVRAWDVVNEAVSDGELGTLRDNVWLRTIGPDYIAKAFRWAHEADPDAVLYYNDYDNADLTVKSNRVYDLLRTLKAQGVPVEGVGIQHHVRYDRRVDDDYVYNANRLAALGLEIALTEMDASIPVPSTADHVAEQNRVYREAMQWCLGQPACKEFTTWGVTDKYSWIPSVSPGYGDALMFDRAYQAKGAFFAVRDVLTSTASAAPATPRAVHADSGNGGVLVSWGGTTDPGASYEVRYGTNPRRLDKTVTVTDATFVRIKGLTNRREYHFAVATRTAAGLSAYSEPVSATPVAALEAPRLGAVRADHKTLVLRWEPVPGAVGYVVRYGPADGELTQRIDVGTATTLRLGGLTNGTEYRVAVLAYNIDGNGATSAVRTGTPATPRTPTVQGRETRGAIAVDGNLNETEWRTLPVRIEKPTYGRTDNTARGAITWDTENIYFAVKVTDKKLVNDSIDPYQDDAVEIYLNGPGNLPTSYDTSTDRHYFLRWNDNTVHEQNGKTAGATYAWKQVPGGWAIELAVSWRSINTVPGETGATVGVDFAVDDDDTGDKRDGQLTAYGYEFNYLDLSSIGRAELSVRYATTQKAVTPIASCVANNGDGTYLAQFSYDNANDGRVRIAAGTRNNAFSPAPADRGQPSVFARGKQVDVVSVPFDGTALTWTLRGPDGVTRTATADSTTAACPVIPAVPLYTDALAAGWSTFSYNTTVDTASTTTVHTGTNAIAATVTGAYGLVGIGNGAAPAKTTPDTAVEFWINLGESTSARTFQLVTSSGAEGAANTPGVFFTIQPGGWVKKTIGVGDFGNPELIGSLFIQDVGGSADAQPTIYLDDIRLLKVKAN